LSGTKAKSEGGAGIPPPTPPSRAARADFGKGCEIALVISQEMVSSRVVNILQDLTFGKNTDGLVGGAARRPLILRRRIKVVPPRQASGKMRFNPRKKLTIRF